MVLIGLMVSKLAVSREKIQGLQIEILLGVVDAFTRGLRQEECTEHPLSSSCSEFD
jgi:hypothetical protein